MRATEKPSNTVKTSRGVLYEQWVVGNIDFITVPSLKMIYFFPFVNGVFHLFAHYFLLQLFHCAH